MSLKLGRWGRVRGGSLPGDWTSAPSAGGSATVGGGRLHVNGASAGTAATYAAGRALEFSATFTAALFQTAGFATDLNAPPWATFSTKGDSLFYARTHNGSVSTDTPLPSSLLGSEHRYRIEWDAGEVRFYVDGTLVATHTLSFAAQMRPLTSDFEPGGGELARLAADGPLSGLGQLRLAGPRRGPEPDWGTLAYDATTPAGTGVALSVRTGDTPTPDGSWSALPWSPTAATSPAAPLHPATAPRSAAATPGARPSWPRSRSASRPVPGREPADNSERTPVARRDRGRRGCERRRRVQRGDGPRHDRRLTVRLRKQGAGTDVAAAVSYAGATATLDPDADLDLASTYEVTVAGSVEDAAGNALGADDTWTFTTGGPGVGFTDTTFADFSAGDTGADAPTSRDRRRRGDPEAAWSPSSPAGWPPTGWSSTTWESQGGGAPAAPRSRRQPAHRRGIRRALTRPSVPRSGSSSARPSLRCCSSTSASATTSTAPGRSSAPTTSPASSSPAPTRAPPRSTPRYPARCSAPNTAIGSSGT